MKTIVQVWIASLLIIALSFHVVALSDEQIRSALEKYGATPVKNSEVKVTIIRTTVPKESNGDIGIRYSFSEVSQTWLIAHDCPPPVGYVGRFIAEYNVVYKQSKRSTHFNAESAFAIAATNLEWNVAEKAMACESGNEPACTDETLTVLKRCTPIQGGTTPPDSTTPTDSQSVGSGSSGSTSSGQGGQQQNTQNAGDSCGSNGYWVSYSICVERNGRPIPPYTSDNRFEQVCCDLG